MKTSIIYFCILVLCFIAFSCKKSETINNPPSTPSNPAPADGSINISLSPILGWSCNDPDGDSVKYDLYVSSVNPPNTLIASNLNTASYAITGLDTNKTYYWRVNAKDSKGSATPGPIWRFTTFYNNLPTQGLVAYYPFNSNANDESGNGNNGTVYGAVLDTDRFNQPNKAYKFNGGTDRIQSDIATIPIGNQSRTFSLWALGIHNENDNFWSESIICYGGGPGTEGDAYEITYNHDPLLSGFGIGICYDVDQYYLASNQFFDGNWKHLVLVYDESTRKMIFYINGQVVGETVLLLNTVTPHFHFNIGIENGNSGLTRPFFGKIDDVRIYNRALSAAEIQELYHEGGWK